VTWRDYFKNGYTSPFGDCRPSGGNPCGRRHRGTDLSHSRTSGTIAVPAPFSGRVVHKHYPGDGTGFGHSVVIETTLGDGGKWKFYIAHGAWASSQKVGDWVTQGQIVLHEGLSGFTSGPCAHFEQQSVKTGNFTDPKPELLRVANGQGDYGQTQNPTPAPVPQPASGNTGAVKGVLGPNPFGIPFTGGLQKIAKLNGYKGALDQDWGNGITSGSMTGFVNFLRNRWGYSGNNELGPKMWAAIARWLRANYNYVGNDVPGPDMRAALSRADTKNWAEL